MKLSLSRSLLVVHHVFSVSLSLFVLLSAAAQAVGGTNLIKYERTFSELRKERGSEKKRRGEVTEGWCVCVCKWLCSSTRFSVRTLSKFDVIVSHFVSCLEAWLGWRTSHWTNENSKSDLSFLISRKYQLILSGVLIESLSSLVWQEHLNKSCDLK